jgi:hypothetical protein
MVVAVGEIGLGLECGPLKSDCLDELSKTGWLWPMSEMGRDSKDFFVPGSFRSDEAREQRTQVVVDGRGRVLFGGYWLCSFARQC